MVWKKSIECSINLIGYDDGFQLLMRPLSFASTFVWTNELCEDGTCHSLWQAYMKRLRFWDLIRNNYKWLRKNGQRITNRSPPGNLKTGRHDLKGGMSL